MPVGVKLYLRVREPLPEATLAALRAQFESELGLNPDEDLRSPYVSLIHEDDPTHVPEPASHWYDTNLWKSYYGRGYERGDLPLFLRCAEWLEAHVPEGDIWYGHDITELSLQPFGSAVRAELSEYYQAVGHTPYNERHKSS